MRMGSGFVIAKVVAIYAGPAGMVMLGQVQSLVSALNGVVVAPLGSGVVRYTAENHTDGYESCAPWWRACVRWLLVLLVMTILLTCLIAQPLAKWLFADPLYAWLVIVVALSLPFSALNTLLGSVINGLQQYKRYIGLSMVSVVIATMVMLVLIVSQKLTGALIAAIVFSALSGLVMLVSSVRQPWFRLRYWWGRVDHQQLKGIGGYVAMAITSAICIPTSLILVRNILVDHVGLAQAGYWQAVYRISEVYLGVITMALSTYYLPRLSSLAGFDAIRQETLAVAKVVMPIVVLLAAAVYVFRDTIITLLFTAQFRPARSLFPIQLVGDIIKILSWLFAYPMLSRGATGWYIGTEVAFSMSFVLLALIFVAKYGVQGANIAYTMNYFLCLIFLYSNSRHFMR